MLSFHVYLQNRTYLRYEVSVTITIHMRLCLRLPFRLRRPRCCGVLWTCPASSNSDDLPNDRERHLGHDGQNPSIDGAVCAQDLTGGTSDNRLSSGKDCPEEKLKDLSAQFELDCSHVIIRLHFASACWRMDIMSCVDNVTAEHSIRLGENQV